MFKTKDRWFDDHAKMYRNFASPCKKRIIDLLKAFSKAIFQFGALLKGLSMRFDHFRIC